MESALKRVLVTEEVFHLLSCSIGFIYSTNKAVFDHLEELKSEWEDLILGVKASEGSHNRHFRDSFFGLPFISYHILSSKYWFYFGINEKRQRVDGEIWCKNEKVGTIEVGCEGEKSFSDLGVLFAFLERKLPLRDRREEFANRVIPSFQTSLSKEKMGPIHLGAIQSSQHQFRARWKLDREFEKDLHMKFRWDGGIEWAAELKFNSDLRDAYQGEFADQEQKLVTYLFGKLNSEYRTNLKGKTDAYRSVLKQISRNYEFFYANFGRSYLRPRDRLFQRSRPLLCLTYQCSWYLNSKIVLSWHYQKFSTSQWKILSGTHLQYQCIDLRWTPDKINVIPVYRYGNEVALGHSKRTFELNFHCGINHAPIETYGDEVHAILTRMIEYGQSRVTESLREADIQLGLLLDATTDDVKMFPIGEDSRTFAWDFLRGRI